MGLSIQNRFFAFGIHFLISLFIFTIFAFVILSYWYPEPLFTADGGWSIFLIIFVVNLALGPVLTLIIFKPGKKGLKFDLSVIATAQCIALLYGGTVLYQERPMYLAFSVDRFALVSQDDIDMSKIRYPELREKPISGPNLVYARMPEDPEERNRFASEVFQGAPDLEFRPEYYEPLIDNLASIKTKNVDINNLKKVSDQYKEKINAFVESNCNDNCIFIPLVGKKRDIVLALNKVDGGVVGGIDIDPWASTPVGKSAGLQ